MNNVSLMTVYNTREQLFHHLSSFTLAEVLDFVNFVEELTSFYILGDYVKIQAVLVELIQLHYIRMVQLLKNFYLRDKCACILLPNIFLPYDFHSPILFGDFELYFLDLSVRPPADCLKDPIPLFNLILLFLNEELGVDRYGCLILIKY